MVRIHIGLALLHSSGPYRWASLLWQPFPGIRIVPAWRNGRR